MAVDEKQLPAKAAAGIKCEKCPKHCLLEGLASLRVFANSFRSSYITRYMFVTGTSPGYRGKVRGAHTGGFGDLLGVVELGESHDLS